MNVEIRFCHLKNIFSKEIQYFILYTNMSKQFFVQKTEKNKNGIIEANQQIFTFQIREKIRILVLNMKCLQHKMYFGKRREKNWLKHFEIKIVEDSFRWLN